jgi:putative FmdB family regulatory protein
MPLYDYTCNECRETFEMIRKFKDRNKPIKCPYCDCVCKQVNISLIARTPRKWEA